MIPRQGMRQWDRAIDGSIDIRGKVVRLDPLIYNLNFANQDERLHGPLFRVEFGNGALGKTGDRTLLGTGVFGEFVSDGESCRVERFEVISVEPEDSDALRLMHTDDSNAEGEKALLLLLQPLESLVEVRMTSSETQATGRQRLNEMVEGLLDADRNRCPDPVFSRHEVRALVLQAIQITREVHPERATEGVERPEFLYDSYERELNEQTLKVAEIELARGFRGP